jgi:hypothetical protein
MVLVRCRSIGIKLFAYMCFKGSRRDAEGSQQYKRARSGVALLVV